MPGDLEAPDWANRLLSRFLVDVDLGQGWQPIPPQVLDANPETPLPEWAGQALDGVKRVRILFPLAERCRD